MTTLSSSHHHLIHNAKIYCGKTLFNTWMVFDKKTGVIQSVGGTDPPFQSFIDNNKTDYKGLLVLPGLHDSHLHMLFYGQQISAVDLKGCRSIQEMKLKLQEFRYKNPSAEWISGTGWEQDLLGRFPVAMDIDEVCRDVPVLLNRVCYHMGVANQKLLDLAGITDSCPVSCEVERYPPTQSGKPRKATGIVKEKTLADISKLKPIDSKEKLGFLKIAIADLLKAGVTSAHPCEKDTWAEFCYLHDNQQLPIRIFYCTYDWPETGSNVVERERVINSFPESHDASRGSMLYCSRIKFFADGSLGSMTAALSQCYLQKPGDHDNGDSNSLSHGNRGQMLITEHELETKLRHIAVDRGYRVEFHVIGDRAAEMVLGVLERVAIDPAKRPVFIHCQILREDLIARMKERGVIANVQPQFVNTDARWLHDKLPPQLHSHAYAWKTLMHAGIKVAGGSDAPVEAPRPLFGIFDAVHRLVGNRDVRENKNVYKPEERLSIHQAIDLYTTAAAFTAGKEQDLGQLLPGYQADFVLLDRDIIAEPQLAATAVVMETWVAGVKRWAFGE